MPHPLYAPTKRAIDVAVSAAALTAAAPLMLGVAGAIRATMGPPVLFRQRRPGLGGEPFTLLKFRTMRDPAPGEEMLSSDAARTTRLGRALRATSLDELPTLVNVLRGEMSLVGPRPLLMRYVGRYTPEQARRHEVKPGVTGWAQIHGRNAPGWEERLARDVWYVDHRSLGLDVRILLATVLEVGRGRGALAATEFTGRAAGAP
jgi:lipopolysaccharide/colanic/teichoic acid biosynthesis glycosyltransferase